MEEQENKPSKEEVDALFKSIDTSRTNTEQDNDANNTDFNQEQILDSNMDEDTAGLLNSFQKLKEEAPGLQTESPFTDLVLNDNINITPDSNINLEADAEEAPQPNIEENSTPPVEPSPQEENNSSSIDEPQNIPTQAEPIQESNVENTEADMPDLSTIDLDLDTPIEMDNSNLDETNLNSENLDFNEDFTDNDSLTPNSEELPDLDQIFNTSQPSDLDVDLDPLQNNENLNLETPAIQDSAGQDNFELPDENISDSQENPPPEPNFNTAEDLTNTTTENENSQDINFSKPLQETDENINEGIPATDIDFDSVPEADENSDFPQEDVNLSDETPEKTPFGETDPEINGLDTPGTSDLDIENDDLPSENFNPNTPENQDFTLDPDDFNLSDDNTNNLQESLTPEPDFSIMEDTPNFVSDVGENQETSFDNSLDDFSFDDPNTDNMDLKLEDITDIGNSFYNPTSFEQQIQEETNGADNVFEDSLLEEPNDTSDTNIKNLKENLSILPTALALHIKQLFDGTDANNPLTVKIKQELEKHDFSIQKIEKLTGFANTQRKKPKKLSLLLFSVLGILIIAGGAYLGTYIGGRTGNNLLQHGLDLINDGRINEGNEIFIHNEPNLKWYNAYTKALIDQGAYGLAEIKLFGDNLQQRGALELEPKNKEALMNLARLFMKEGLYDKALSTDATFNGKDAKSLSYLKLAYPDDLEVQDLVGQAKIGWAESTQDNKTKETQLTQAYGLYIDLDKKYPENSTVLSRLLEISLLSHNPKIQEQIKILSSRNILDTLEIDTLAKVGLYYLDRGSLGQATVFFNTLKIKNGKTPEKEYTALAYYFIGKFYLLSGDLKSAENNLIRSVYKNTQRDSQDNIISVKNAPLQGNISNALGRIYMTLLQQYSDDNDFNKKNKKNYTDLALYHLKESQKYNPKDPMNYYLIGEIAYTVDKDYSKAIDHYKQAISLLQQENKEIPIDLSFNYGNSLYRKQEYNQAIQVLSELRSESPLYYPALEYLLGMSYLKTDVYSQAVDKMNRALEFYTPELQKLQQKGYSSNITEDKILYFASVINNNLGVIYQREGERLNNDAMKNHARTYFYSALEYSKRMNPNTTLSYPSLNLQSSLFEGNLNITNSTNIPGRSALLYEYTPNTVWEYK